MSNERWFMLTGDYCGETVPEKMKSLDSELKKAGEKYLRLDLSGITCIDFNAISKLLTLKNRRAGTGSAISLEKIPLRIERLMRLFRIPV